MNVLIVRPDGIGDVLLSLPVATQLRSLLPGVTIGFLTSPTVAPLLECHPDVDYVRTIGFTAPLSELRRAFSGGIDAAIFLKPFRRLMWAAWLARVPLRVATGYRWYSLLANRRVYEHRSEFSKHESEYNIEMLSGLQLYPAKVHPPTLVLTDQEREAGALRWTAVSSPRIVVHPGGLSARRWRPGHYRDLVVELGRAGYGVMLTGSQTERSQFEQDAPSTAALSAGTINCMGQLSIRELMAVIANADMVISGATGPAHIAAALKIPTVSLFDPRRNNLPVRWKPLGTGILLRPDVPTCDKCLGEICPYWDCLDRITIDKVVAAVARVTKSSTRLTILHL
ncbi:MAG: glycosyltransferase family 9 protein [Nitrospira sp.]|nr:glycosyltransferase family 9 protein [Nitrospira sp.]MDR4467625.1 glycosyltransferase family 9 protein [Nitrospira sp.]